MKIESNQVFSPVSKLQMVVHDSFASGLSLHYVVMVVTSMCLASNCDVIGRFSAYAAVAAAEWYVLVAVFQGSA